MRMQRVWIKLACYLIGWNYAVLERCSEISKRDAKRYCSAILLISIVWFFIGYAFAERYLGLKIYGRIFSGLVAILFIIQVERQVIMSDKSRGMVRFRGWFAVLMALIGAVLIDQYIFKHDIDGAIEESRKDKIDAAVQKNDIDFLQRQKKLQDDLKSIDNESKRQSDVFNNEVYGKGKSSQLRGYGTIAKAQENRLKDLSNQKAAVNDQLTKLFVEKLNNRSKTTKRIKDEPRGFLEEFNIMIKLIFTNITTFLLYCVLFGFFLLIELLVVMTKSLSKTQNDYERIVEFQREVRLKQLMILEEENSKRIGRDASIQVSSNLLSKNI